MDSIRSTFPNISEPNWTLLKAWASLMREWNEKVNLISRKDIEYLEVHHLAHCLAITNYLKLKPGACILDVGTGGGLPGIPMAICYPQARFTLIDSVGKKITVVQDLIDRLGLRNVEAKQIRAEAVNQQFDFITGRAVKNLPEFFGWIRNNLRRGGRHSIPNGVLYWKGGTLHEELESLGIQPRKIFSLETTLSDAYFERKYILHFDESTISRNLNARSG